MRFWIKGITMDESSVQDYCETCKHPLTCIAAMARGFSLPAVPPHGYKAVWVVYQADLGEWWNSLEYVEGAMTIFVPIDEIADA